MKQPQDEINKKNFDKHSDKGNSENDALRSDNDLKKESDKKIKKEHDSKRIKSEQQNMNQNKRYRPLL